MILDTQGYVKLVRHSHLIVLIYLELRIYDTFPDIRSIVNVIKMKQCMTLLRVAPQIKLLSPKLPNRWHCCIILEFFLFTSVFIHLPFYKCSTDLFNYLIFMKLFSKILYSCGPRS